jgi:hypothetical protein
MKMNKEGNDEEEEEHDGQGLQNWNTEFDLVTSARFCHQIQKEPAFM